MRAVYVHAEAVVPLDQLNPEDRDVPGVYLVILNSSVPEDALASAALDLFHSLVAVGTLDDFIFRVTNVIGEPKALLGIIDSATRFETREQAQKAAEHATYVLERAVFVTESKPA